MMSNMSPFLFILANILIPISLYIFATGFFPYKPFLPGQASFDGFDESFATAAPFDKVIFMVVDALRRSAKLGFLVCKTADLFSDFVYSPTSGFNFTQSYVCLLYIAYKRLISCHRLIRSGAAIPFTAHAASPTITMPRIKAITTGSIPSFLDVILNFDESDSTSSLANQDNWLAQLKAKQDGNLVMYGDDTWLKLFPNIFLRTDGTTSFFVSVSDQLAGMYCLMETELGRLGFL